MLKDHLWIFGGKFVGKYIRRSLVVGEQLDFPLLRPDGSLHLVEIKTARLPRLVKEYRNKLIVGNDINEVISVSVLDQREPSVSRVRRGWRMAGPPRARWPSMPLIAAQRIMCSETPGSRS